MNVQATAELPQRTVHFDRRIAFMQAIDQLSCFGKKIDKSIDKMDVELNYKHAQEALTSIRQANDIAHFLVDCLHEANKRGLPWPRTQAEDDRSTEEISLALKAATVPDVPLDQQIVGAHYYAHSFAQHYRPVWIAMREALAGLTP